MKSQLEEFPSIALEEKARALTEDDTASDQPAGAVSFSGRSGTEGQLNERLKQPTLRNFIRTT